MSLGSIVFVFFKCVEPVTLDLCTVCKVEVFIVDVYSDYGDLGCDAV